MSRGAGFHNGVRGHWSRCLFWILALDAAWRRRRRLSCAVRIERRGALDLMVAEFDDRSGTIKRPGELRDCMKRSTCYVDDSVQTFSVPPGC